MERYAQIMGGVVANVIESDIDPDGINGNWIACGNAGPGWLYADGVFSAPAPAADTAPRLLAVGAFFDRFGAHKWPILADTNPVVQALIKDCSVRTHIDLDDPQLPAGLGLLVEAGHAIDVQAILTAPVLPGERP